jgi:hypothetical protein
MPTSVGGATVRRRIRERIEQRCSRSVSCQVNQSALKFGGSVGRQRQLVREQGPPTNQAPFTIGGASGTGPGAQG